jgi:hypothetical protein
VNYTAIIGVHAGGANLHRILGALSTQTVKPTTVMVWDNSGTLDMSHAYTLFRSLTNHGCFARFMLAGLCRTEAVMVFDDDTVPGNRWAANCIAVMEAHQRKAILGCRGIRLTKAAYAPFREAGLYAKNQHTMECDLVGHSWFFMREHAHFMFDQLPIRWDTGEDMHFSAHAKMAGIRTYCPPHPSNNRDAWGSIHPKLGKAPGRLHTTGGRSNWDRRSQVVKGLIGRGWKPLYME